MYLDHLITAESIVPDPSKADVRDLAPSCDPTGVCRFLGMASYYHRFIKDYAALGDPLTSLEEVGRLGMV